MNGVRGIEVLRPLGKVLGPEIGLRAPARARPVDGCGFQEFMLRQAQHERICQSSGSRLTPS